MTDPLTVVPVALDPRARRAALARMAEARLDVLVIGGGVTGAGIALDAATRGLAVGLVEQRDLASGTSSRSSKLLHGGLRYLEQLDLGLVREALRERDLHLTRLSPHLARPVSFLFPLTHHGWERAYVGAGIALYDTLGGARNLPRHQHLSRRGALELAPALRRDALTGAIRYYDASVDDARHTMEIARTAAAHGAHLATSTRVVDLVREEGRIVGARVLDLESGQEHTLRARQVVNATGVWTDDIQAFVGRGRISVRASKGVHLVVPRDRIASRTGIILRTASSVLFVIPWFRHWIIGTTDTDWELDLAHPAASASDIRYLLDHVNRVLRVPLTHDDVQGVYAGLRPLLHGESDATSELTREHAVATSAAGMISVAGGKYTTYRVMAEDAVDAVVRALGIAAPPSRTAEVPLLGARGLEDVRAHAEELALEHELGTSVVERLLGRYGSLTTEVLAAIAERPELGREVPGTGGHIAAEFHYAASHEGALHLEDALARRTHVSIETFDRGLTAAGSVARLLGETLGWDDEAMARELAHYRARVEAERESQRMPDDRTADSARLGAPDVRLAPTG
jgi:glycerol-3-phosphate dehydrogenase